jgi:hypothetical protein
LNVSIFLDWEHLAALGSIEYLSRIPGNKKPPEVQARGTSISRMRSVRLSKFSQASLAIFNFQSANGDRSKALVSPAPHRSSTIEAMAQPQEGRRAERYRSQIERRSNAMLAAWSV